MKATEVRGEGIGLYLHLSPHLSYDLLCPRDELRSAMLPLFNSSFSIILPSIKYAAKQTVHSFCSETCVSRPSLLPVCPLSHKCLWREMFNNHPIVWKREMQVQLPIKSFYLLSQNHTSPSPFFISELLKQRDYASLIMYLQPWHSAWFIVVAQ